MSNNLLTRITRPLFRSKAEFQAFITGRSGPTRAQAMHAGLPEAPKPRPAAPAAAQPEPVRKTRAQLATEAAARIKARQDALYSKLFGGDR